MHFSMPDGKQENDTSLFTVLDVTHTKGWSWLTEMYRGEGQKQMSVRMAISFKGLVDIKLIESQNTNMK